MPISLWWILACSVHNIPINTIPSTRQIILTKYFAIQVHRNGDNSSVYVAHHDRFWDCVLFISWDQQSVSVDNCIWEWSSFWQLVCSIYIYKVTKRGSHYQESSLNRIKSCHEAIFFSNFEYKLSTRIIYVCIKYSLWPNLWRHQLLFEAAIRIKFMYMIK